MSESVKETEGEKQKSMSKPAVAPKPPSTAPVPEKPDSVKPSPPLKKSFIKATPTATIKPSTLTSNAAASASKATPTILDAAKTTPTIPDTAKTTPTNPETAPMTVKAPPPHNSSHSRERPITMTTNRPVRVVKPHTLSSPPPPPLPPLPSVASLSDSQDSLFTQLTRKMRQNDYYSLLNVSATADHEELSRARREITSRLHPDHFTNDPSKKEK